MDKYKPEEKAEDATDDSRMEAGTEVGKLARELFGKPVDVTETVNGQLNLPAMTDRTQTRDNAYRWGMLMWFNQLLLEKGTITEAEFRKMRLEIEKKIREPEKGGTK